MRLLSFIYFQIINAGLGHALGRHAVSALSDYAQHRVSYYPIQRGLIPCYFKEIGAFEVESKRFTI